MTAQPQIVKAARPSATMRAAMDAARDHLAADHPGWNVWYVLGYLGVVYCASPYGRPWQTLHADDVAHLAEYIAEADADAETVRVAAEAVAAMVARTS